MLLPRLTLERLVARPIVLKLERPIVARIATIADWPLILIGSIPTRASSGAATLSPTP